MDFFLAVTSAKGERPGIKDVLMSSCVIWWGSLGQEIGCSSCGISPIGCPCLPRGSRAGRDAIGGQANSHGWLWPHLPRAACPHVSIFPELLCISYTYLNGFLSLSVLLLSGSTCLLACYFACYACPPALVPAHGPVQSAITGLTDCAFVCRQPYHSHAFPPSLPSLPQT